MSTNRNLLESLSVVDFGLGLAAGLVTRIFADAGARIQRIEPSAGDPSYALYPAGAVWRRGATTSKAKTLSDAITSVSDALARADVCVVGGEDYPGLDWKADIEELARRYPRLVILQITGYPHGTPEADAPSVDLFAQAFSGLVHEQYSARPMVCALPLPSYGAALQGLMGILSALIDRERTGKGQIVRTSLFEGTLSWIGITWFQSERTDWSMDLAPPKDISQLIFRCADGKYIQFSLVTTSAREHVYETLGIPFEKTGDKHGGLPTKLTGNPRHFYGDVDLLQSYIIKWKRADLLEKLWALGLSAEPVNQPGEGWDDEQVVHNGVIRRDADGTRRIGLPFAFNINAPSDDRGAPKKADDAPPLQGVRVIDFGTFAAGPHSSMLLADLGADVIKVESLEGDPVHRIYRPYSMSSRGKRHVAINVKNPKGLEIALRLSLGADVVTHNFRPGAAKRLGIDSESLHRLKPSLIVLESSDYGATGPKALRAGIDYPLQAFCGHEVRAGGESGELICYNHAVIDYGQGMLGAISTLMAQFNKQRTGSGAAIEACLLNAGLFLLSELIQSPDGTFLPLPKLDREQTGFHPAEQLYKAKDSWIAIAARDEEMSRRLLAVLGLEKKIATSRNAWGGAEAKMIAEAVAQKDSASILSALKAADVWAAPCRETGSKIALADGNLRKSGAVLATQHPRYGEILQIGKLFSLSRARMTPSGQTPATGTHTKEVLTELGYTDDEISKLSADGVVGVA